MKMPHFHISIPNKTSNLYIFKHGIEHQQVFLEPGDSVNVFVNTKDFDESLTYHGNGAKKNNFLIRSFLKNEKDELKSYKIVVYHQRHTIILSKIDINLELMNSIILLQTN